MWQTSQTFVYFTKFTAATWSINKIIPVFTALLLSSEIFGYSEMVKKIGPSSTFFTLLISVKLCVEDWPKFYGLLRISELMSLCIKNFIIYKLYQYCKGLRYIESYDFSTIRFLHTDQSPQGDKQGFQFLLCSIHD